MSSIFIRNAKLRFRYDVFGGLCWFPRGNIYRLTSEETALVDLLGSARNLYDMRASYLTQNVNIESKLLKHGLITECHIPPVAITDREYEQILSEIKVSKNQKINKPFWVHIQPFKFCNQNCIHCYCYGNSQAEKFVLSLDDWKSIIDKICAYGILDVYLTGGETLILNDSLELTEYIIQKGLGTGLSTNAMSVSDTTLKKIKEFNIKYIQVSIDGATSETNDRIRGVKGALHKSILGIRKLQSVVEPIINTVVNRVNFNEVEEIVRLGKSLGVKKFKVFPQKSVGRAIAQRELLLTDEEFDQLISICKKIEDSNKVEIEYLTREQTCGSGYSGFAINEKGDAFPCIFGTEAPEQRIGNMLTESIEDIWFNSKMLNSFRAVASLQPCKRCEECF